MPGAGVEERGGGGQVVEPAHQPVQRRHFVHGALRLVLGQPGRDPQHEVLGRLDDLTGVRVAQQVPAVQGPQPEVAEAVVRAVGERALHQRVEGGRVGGDERGGTVRDQALAVPDGDRGGEGDRALAGRLVRDGEGQQPGGEPGVRGVLGDQPRGGLGGQRPQLGLVRPGAAATQRGGGDPAGVGVGQIGGQAGQGPQQCGSRSVLCGGLGLGCCGRGDCSRIGWRDGHVVLSLARLGAGGERGSPAEAHPGQGSTPHGVHRPNREARTSGHPVRSSRMRCRQVIGLTRGCTKAH